MTTKRPQRRHHMRVGVKDKATGKPLVRSTRSRISMTISEPEKEWLSAFSRRYGYSEAHLLRAGMTYLRREWGNANRGGTQRFLRDLDQDSLEFRYQSAGIPPPGAPAPLFPDEDEAPEELPPVAAEPDPVMASPYRSAMAMRRSQWRLIVKALVERKETDIALQISRECEPFAMGAVVQIVWTDATTANKVFIAKCIVEKLAKKGLRDV